MFSTVQENVLEQQPRTSYSSSFGSRLGAAATSKLQQSFAREARSLLRLLQPPRHHRPQRLLELRPEETELMGLHYQIGVDVLQACHVAPEVLEFIAQSQATQQGLYAEQHGGSELLLGARILAVADAYDSLSTDQVYRDGKQHEEILKILMDDAGTKFDGNVVCALDRWVGGSRESSLSREQQAPSRLARLHELDGAPPFRAGAKGATREEA